MGWAIFELGAVGFTTCQKPYCVSIHELYRFHIQNYGYISVDFEQSLHLC